MESKYLRWAGGGGQQPPTDDKEEESFGFNQGNNPDGCKSIAYNADIDGDTFETRAYEFMKGGNGGVGIRDIPTKNMKNGFVLYPTPGVGNRPDEEELQMNLQEMEQRLFGVARVNTMQQTLSDGEVIPIKTGTGVKLMKNGPKHIMDAEDYESLYVP